LEDDTDPKVDETLNVTIDAIQASGRDITSGSPSTSQGTIEDDD